MRDFARSIFARFGFRNNCRGSAPLLAHAVNAAALQIFRHHRDAKFDNRRWRS
jgi:hypothetical protein